MDFPNLTVAKRIYLDLETKDPNLKKLGPGWCRMDGRVVGVAVGADGLPASYYPIAHEGFPNLDRASVLAWVQGAVLESGLPIGGHNLPYDVGWLLAEGLTLPRSLSLRDSMIGAALLDEDLDHYSLSALGKLWLGEDKAESAIKSYADEHLLDPKADLWRMPPEVVGPYACQDVDLTAKLIQHIEHRIQAETTQQVGTTLLDAYELESSLIPLSVLMRWVGIRIDEQALYEAGAKFRMMKEAAIKEMWELSGLTVEPWKQASCLPYFAKCGVSVPLRRVRSGKKKGEMAPTITADWLEAMASVPACALLHRARKAAKNQSTFVEGWQKHVVNGRLHPEWHQTRSDEGGTISFRYSCSNPNLQQVPYRDPDMAKILRPVFLADSGESLYSLDYSQQEPRLLVHYAAENRCRGAKEAEILYQDPAADFHNISVELTGLVRDVAKQINLGVIYGMGVGKMAIKINKSEKETKGILATYKERLPFMHEMAKLAMRVAADRGVIRTIGGHKRRFELWEPDEFTNHDDERPVPRRRPEAEAEWAGKLLRRAYAFTGLNALIQTSAAAQMKRAMLACYADGIIPKLQIHDELLLSGSSNDADRAERHMIEAVKLTVPTLVDRASGLNWYEANDFKTPEKHPAGLSAAHHCGGCNG